MAASEFEKSLFTYWLRINKPCLKTRVVLQILSHEARNKIPVKYLVFSTLTGFRIVNLFGIVFDISWFLHDFVYVFRKPF